MTVRLKTDISICPTDHSAVVLNERTGQYWQLNETGANILGALLNGAAAEATADRIASVRPVTRERALAAVATLVGAITLSRVVDDPNLSKAILRSAEASVIS